MGPHPPMAMQYKMQHFSIVVGKDCQWPRIGAVPYKEMSERAWIQGYTRPFLHGYRGLGHETR